MSDIHEGLQTGLKYHQKNRFPFTKKKNIYIYTYIYYENHISKYYYLIFTIITHCEEKRLYIKTIIKRFKYFEDLDTIGGAISENWIFNRKIYLYPL